jgi:cell wall-associated NlpC family hydrolase
MSQITKISALASSFPTAEVAYEDLLALPYRQNARASDGQIDCMGVVLEIYRRAGLKLPDPILAGESIFGFAELFDVVADLSTLQLYDLVYIQKSSNHIGVVVRPGLVLDASEKRNVCMVRVNVFKAIPRIQWYRVKPTALPQ